MKPDLVEFLACPSCQGELQVRDEHAVDGAIESGALACAGCSARYPIIAFVPRFVPPENYATSFGFQWNRFRHTQLDSFTGQPITRDRFFAHSGWTERDMAGRWTLDVGCGAGRFAEVALGAGESTELSRVA